MKNFLSQEVEQIGLFTFYRQQAELEEKCLLEKREQSLEVDHEMLEQQKWKDKYLSEKRFRYRKKEKGRNRSCYKLLENYHDKDQEKEKGKKQILTRSSIITQHTNYNTKAKKYIKLIAEARKSKLDHSGPKQFQEKTNNLQTIENSQINITNKCQNNSVRKYVDEINGTQQAVVKQDNQQKQYLKIFGEGENKRLKQYFSSLHKRKSQKIVYRADNQIKKLPKIVVQNINENNTLNSLIKKKVNQNYSNFFHILCNKRKIQLKNSCGRPLKGNGQKTIKQFHNLYKINNVSSMSNLIRTDRNSQ